MTHTEITHSASNPLDQVGFTMLQDVLRCIEASAPVAVLRVGAHLGFREWNDYVEVWFETGVERIAGPALPTLRTLAHGWETQ
jgi:hypothetical protein